MKQKGLLAYPFFPLLMVAIVLLAVQPARAESCPKGSRCVYIPVVTNSASTSDLVLSGIEVTQAVQDQHNNVPLVAGRRTMIRIYAWAAGSAKPLSNVQIMIGANRGGAAMNNSPFLMTTTLPVANNRADTSTTINYELPAAWLNGTVDLTIRLDPDNKISETDETNNDYHLRLTFNPVPPLQIKIVPIQYTHKNGVVYPAPTKDTIQDLIFRLYPVNRVDVSWHAPYPFTGDLSSAESWHSLLDQITAMKKAEGAPPSQVYYALAPITKGSSTWFKGGIAGVGWVGSRVSVGLDAGDKAGEVAAHEIGHNLGMLHTPCGTSSSVDPAYPYADGMIGQYGLDIQSGKLYLADHRDLMSYCSPKWISDYTYKILYQAQIQHGAQQTQILSGSTSQNSLLVRYRFDDDGVKTLPAYILPGAPQAEPGVGEYTVQLLDAQDGLLSETQVQSHIFELDGAERSAINAVIPLDGRPAARLRLLKDGQVLTEQPFRTDISMQAQHAETTTNASITSIRWTDPERPSLVRYSTDSGQTWTILGVDIAGGVLRVSPAMLPDPDVQFEAIPASAWE